MEEVLGRLSKFKPLISLIFFLSIFSVIKAQNTVTVKIIEESSNTTIPNVLIKERKSNKLYQTDSLGIASFEVSQFPVSLFIFSTGFVSQYIIVKDTNTVFIKLVSEEFVLNQVDIISVKDTFQFADSLNCLKFEITENRIVALFDYRYKYKSNYLLLYSTDGNMISFKKVKGNFKKLIAACTGDIFVGSRDSLWQISINKDSISLHFPIKYNYFKEVMEPCLLSVNGITFHAQKKFMKLAAQVSTSFVASTGEKITNDIIYFEDTLTTSWIRKKYNINYFLKRRDCMTNPPRFCLSYEEIKTNLDDLIGFVLYDSIIGRRIKEVFSPLKFSISNYLDKYYIFDYSNGNIMHVNNLLKITKIVPFENREELIKSPATLVDETNGKVYCFTRKDGSPHLRMYNRNTGKIAKEFKISDYRFMTNPRVYGDKLFFITNSKVNPDAQIIHFIKL